MKIIQGFINVDALIKNIPNENSIVGEISTFSRTFSKEKGYYRNRLLPGYQFISFKSIYDDSGLEFEINSDLSDLIILISDYVVRYAANNIRPYILADYFQEIRDQTSHLIEGLEMGEIVQDSDFGLPGFISFYSRAHDAEVKLWFADAAFADQYKDYQITVIPPVANIDVFMTAFTEVQAAISTVSMEEFGNRIQAAKRRYPETSVRLFDIEFQNRNNSVMRIKTTWGFLIYGTEGDNEDAIMEALASYLLANSLYNSAHWEMVFPQVFRRTEMVVIPHWKDYARANLTRRASTFSSIVRPLEHLGFAEEFVPFYPASHIRARAVFAPTPYRNLMVTIIPGTANLEDKNTFQKVFWDYMPVPSTNPDFGQQSNLTQDFSLFFSELLNAAETVTRTSPLPDNARRVERDGKLYVQARFYEISFLVAAAINGDFV